MARRLRLLSTVIATVAISLGFSISSTAQTPDPSWYSNKLLEPEIERAVSAAILRMPFRQETAANAIVAPLRYRYTNQNAPAGTPFVPGSRTTFAAEWTIKVHTNNGRQYIIPTDRLESVFKQRSNPCGILKIVPGLPPFGPASCAAMKGEGFARPGELGSTAIWRLKPGYPISDENFDYLSKGNPKTRAFPGGFSVVGDRGVVTTFSFVPPPPTMVTGRTYEVSLTGDSVVPDDDPACAPAGMIWVDAPTKSVHEGKLIGSKRENSSFYVMPRCKNPQWVNGNPAGPQSWAYYDRLTFLFKPSSGSKKFSVLFYPMIGVRAVAAEFQYEPEDRVGDNETGGEFTGKGTVYKLGGCADITVNVELNTRTPKGAVVTSTSDAINASGETAKKYAIDITAELISAIEPLCKKTTENLTYPFEEPSAIIRTKWPPDEVIVEPRWPPTPIGMRRLVEYYNYEHNDSVTISSDDAIRAALSGGYKFVGDAGGYVYANQLFGTVPLKLFHSPVRRDYFTTGTAEGERTAIAAGYSLVGIEGYVFASSQPMTVPLKLFWSNARLDNYSTATPDGESSALRSGYAFGRVEGYISKALPTAPQGCGLGRLWEITDSVSTSWWIRRGTESVFDSRTTLRSGQTVDGVVTINLAGSQITAQREHANWGKCQYTGTLGTDGTSASGSYYCPDGIRHNWSGSIKCN